MCICQEPLATAKRATLRLANLVSKTNSETWDTRRRSGAAQRKWLSRLWTQQAEKQGERKGGVTQTTPGVEEDNGERGLKETTEWKEARISDWNRSPGVPAAMVVRPRSTPCERAAGPAPGEEAGEPLAGVGGWWVSAVEVVERLGPAVEVSGEQAAAAT
jgi:hypothetical protein